jgi:CubicO group peptidase (beta-lactamase class C family)
MGKAIGIWLVLSVNIALGAEPRRTEIAIRGDQFLINGKPTYAGRSYQGKKIEGLLFNSRMVQGIFDDLNPATRSRWAYPDTGKWDPERNTREFVAVMPHWRRHGLLAFTINLQGGSPTGYANEQPWHNSAITPEGDLRPAYMARLKQILDKSDELGMAVILGTFYFGQDQRLKDEDAIKRAVDNTIDWLFDRGYRHVLIEVNNECNVRYDHAILKPDRVHELIERVKKRTRNGQRFLVGTSYGGGTIPKENVVRVSDFLLLHGNGVSKPERIAEMVRQTRQVRGYRPMPILFNEDDHFDFDKPANNLLAALGEYASWGYFDYRMKGEGFEDGYQSVPVNWGISSPRKKALFAKLGEITGSDVLPGKVWEQRTPSEAGLDAKKLDQLQKLVGGRGCVMRNGFLAYSWGDMSKSQDLASAAKPVISTLLLMAVQDGKLKSVDDRLANVEPRLKDLNGGKDSRIAWRHLASQTSGYGLTEKPGEAWAYNDFALALYYQALMARLFHETGTDVLRSRLAAPLQFEDSYAFDALGAARPGRLALSLRDFARIGLLYLRDGYWGDRHILPAKSVEMALNSPVPAGLPRTAGKNADMLSGQKSMGGGKNITPIGPGYYSFNWWLNRTDKNGKRLFAALPPDTFIAAGHGGEKIMICIPRWDLIVSWYTNEVNDFDASPTNPNTKCNRAARLIAEAVKE